MNKSSKKYNSIPGNLNRITKILGPYSKLFQAYKMEESRYSFLFLRPNSQDSLRWQFSIQVRELPKWWPKWPKLCYKRKMWQANLEVDLDWVLLSSFCLKFTKRCRPLFRMRLLKLASCNSTQVFQARTSDLSNLISSWSDVKSQ